MDMKLRHERILDCRYYNGEDKCPESINEMFWNYEMLWANREDWDWTEEKDRFKRMGLEFFENGDGTPFDFKCLLLNRYLHWNLGTDADTFSEWYISNYQQPRKTNRQRRAEKRKPKLIAQCRYYNGEEENPYKNTDFEMIWSYESCWVERLSESYQNAQQLYWHLGQYPGMIELAKKYKIPRSLLGLFINRYEYWHSMGEVYIDGFKDWVESVYVKNGKMP